MFVREARKGLDPTVDRIFNIASSVLHFQIEQDLNYLFKQKTPCTGTHGIKDFWNFLYFRNVTIFEFSISTLI